MAKFKHSYTAGTALEGPVRTLSVSVSQWTLEKLQRRLLNRKWVSIMGDIVVIFLSRFFKIWKKPRGLAGADWQAFYERMDEERWYAVCGLFLWRNPSVNPKYFSVHCFEGFMMPSLLNSMFYYIPEIDAVVIPATLGRVAWMLDSHTYLGVRLPVSPRTLFSQIFISLLPGPSFRLSQEFLSTYFMVGAGNRDFKVENVHDWPTKGPKWSLRLAACHNYYGCLSDQLLN